MAKKSGASEIYEGDRVILHVRFASPIPTPDGSRCIKVDAEFTGYDTALRAPRFRFKTTENPNRWIRMWILPGGAICTDFIEGSKVVTAKPRLVTP